MISRRKPTTRIDLLLVLLCAVALGSFGCAEDGGQEGVGDGSSGGQVTANNFEEVAGAAGEIAIKVIYARDLLSGLGFEAALVPAPAMAGGAVPVDPLCISGSSTFTPDPEDANRFSVDYDLCDLPADFDCIVDGRLWVERGPGGAFLLRAQADELSFSCASSGFDVELVSEAVECAAENDCALLPGSVRGEVSGLDFEVSDLSVTGPTFAFDVQATVVDPDHGRLEMEGLGLDATFCTNGVPYVGSVGIGRTEGSAPAVLAFFESSCTQFTACYLETQEALDTLDCTLTRLVQWAELAPVPNASTAVE